MIRQVQNSQESLFNTSVDELLKQYKMLNEFTSSPGGMEKIDPSQGMSQKQMMKMAKKFGKKMKL